jgi:hypothetical protein
MARLGALAVSALLLAACANGESAEVADRAIELQSILGEAIEMGAFVAAEPSVPFDDPVVAYADGLGDSLGPHVDDLGATFTRLAGGGTDGFGHEDGDEGEHNGESGSLNELLSVPADQLLPTFRRLMPAVLDNCATAAADVAATATDDGLREIAAGALEACQDEAGRLASLR